MSNHKKSVDIEKLQGNVQEMENLRYEHEMQQDWEDDIADPVERSMVTKNGIQTRNLRGARRFRCGFNRIRSNHQSRRFSDVEETSSASSEYCNLYSSSSPSSPRSFSPNSSGSPRGGRRRYRGRTHFGYRSPDGERFTASPVSSTSVSGQRPSWKLTAPNLAKCLSEFDNFEATLLQLFDMFKYDYKHMERIASRNNHSFEVEREMLQLRPKVSLCASHLGKEGCDEPESCNMLHICLKYAVGNCKVENCIFGHVWHTNHNKRILYDYNLNYLPIKRLFHLFKTIILPAAKEDELKICEKYNVDNCNDKDCPQLHLCLEYLASQCSESDCKLSHNVLNENTCAILKNHGLSLNESPKDIMLNICSFPEVKESIEALSMSQDVNDTDDKSTEEFITVKDKMVEVTINTQEEKIARNLITAQDETAVTPETVDVKTVWSHDLKGDVTVHEICYDSVEGFCAYEESGCWRLHCAYHFHWQVNTTLGKKKSWINLTEEQDFALEKAYCDPSISKIDLPLLDPVKFKASEKGLLLILKGRSKWEANFNTMELTLTGQDEVLDLRRLCTEDTRNETPAPCTWKWYFADKNKKWIEYGNVDSTGLEQLKCNINSQNIEKHFHSRSKSPLSFQNQSFAYILDLQKMIQTNLNTQVSRKVRRRPTPHLKDKEKMSKSDIPLTWEPMQPEERSKRVTLAPSSDEYKTLSSYVQTHAQNNSYNILKIERVQNRYVWKAFQNKIREMKAIYKNDATVNILQLFHGTGPDIVPKICEENFDWRLHGTSTGQAYGRGTYFSSLSSYSYDYSRPDSNGYRFMFVAKVAVGTTTTGNAGMSRPPINQQYGIPYDSTVNSVSNPTIIVKYDKQEYYPEYIITLA